MNILEVKDLCKTYIVNKRQNNVLKNVNFTVSEGEMVAIMGPSGSGKSTLLYAVSGMDDITSGEVKFCDKNIAKMNPKELANLRLDEMGFIFQQMYMLKNLTVLDNIILPAVESDKNVDTRKEIVRQGENLMRKLGIIEIADNDINEVSGGQLQRACICRSMMNKPKVLFADEPTGALNRTASNEVMEELVKLNKDLEYQRGFLASVQKKLSNERFVNNAPAAVVEGERRKLADAETKIKALEESIAALSK